MSNGDGGLEVIYGDNEDGKSTTLRAIRGLLYRIDERPRDAYRFSGSQLRIGGTLCRKSGEELSVVRRKGRKSTLSRAGTDEPLPDNALEPFIGGVDETEFSKRYGIDHAELVEGSKGILDQTGDIGKVLFSAATGTASIKNALEQLENDAERLFKPRAFSTKIYTLTTEYADRAREAKDRSLPSADWTRLLQERDEVAQQRGRQDEEKRRLDQEKSGLERVKRVRPLLAQFDQLKDDLAGLGAVVDLPQDFEQVRSAAIIDKRNAESQLQKIAAKKEQLTASAAVRVPTSVLERAETIAMLGQKFGSYDQEQKDKPAQEAKRRQHVNDARERLKAIQAGLDIEKVDSLRPLLARERTVQQLASQREKLGAEQQQIQHELLLKKEKLERLQTEQAKVAEERDPKQLSAAVREVQRAGELDEQIREDTDNCEQMKSKCTLDLERLGLWNGSEENFERLPLPGAENVQHYESQFDDVVKSLRINAERQHETAEEQKGVAGQIATLARGGQVPTTEDLKKLREHRDEGWSLVRRQYIEKEKVDKEVRTYANDRVLEDVYEEAVKQADEVVDRLRSDADRVKKHESLEEELAKYTRKQKELKEEERNLLAMQESLQGEWEGAWAPLGIEPRSPKEMAAWLARAEKLREKLDKLCVAQREKAALVKKRGTSIKGLSAEIEALGESLDGLARDQLRPVLDRAQQLVEEIKENLARQKELASAAQDAKAELKRAEEDVKRVQERLDQWQREWDAGTRGFGVLGDQSVIMVQTALEQLKAFFVDLDRADEIRRRIYGIDKRIADFEKEVDAFAESIGQPRGSQPISQYVAGLSDSLTQARKIATQRETVREQQQALESEEIDAKGVSRDAEARLAELRKQAKVDCDDNLLAAGERSYKARKLRLELASHERLILQAGDSRSIDELSGEALGIQVDTLEAQIAQKKDAIAQLDQEHSQTAEREGALKSQIEARDGTAAAAEANERAALALAQLRDEVRTYLKLRAAALILQNQIESYRQKNQTPVLRRAGELFATLTLGSFKGLRDEVDDEDHPVLKGVRPDNQEVGVEGMSDGARDQLYLALRLATLEQSLDNGEPMPVIVDDILIGFDDARTEACLKVLVDLAKRTQVLVFTHHRRVAEIARALGKNGKVGVQEI